MQIHKSTTMHACAFLALQTSLSASGFYVRMWLLRQQHHMHALWYYCECASKTDREEKKLLNKVVIFIFFATKSILVAS